MAETQKSNVIIPEILAETVRGAFAQKAVFSQAALVRLGILTINDTFTGSADDIGNEVTVPYFGTIGEFTANTEGSSATPVALKMTSEKATVARDSLAFEVTTWASLGGVEDPYAEASRQIVEAGARAIDRRSIDAAVATGVLTKDVYSSTVPRKIDYDLVVDAKTLWGDESGPAALIVHSKTRADMLKLKSSGGFPLLVPSQNEGEFDRFQGMPVVESDRLPLTGSTMGTVTSAGSSPPVLTLSGTPTGPWDLVIECQVGGAHATATIRFSTDGGVTWSADLTTAGVGVALPLTDTATDSLVGNEGATGISAAFAAGTFDADNKWVAKANLKATSLIVRPGALVFWYNRAALALKTDTNILKDSGIGAMHLYYAAHRYRRVRGGRKPGVIRLQHNVSDV